ncbi:hypothetical protein [Ulvibacterium sp.]|uniref:hypothetical protein n=1 Tax=Ulvibacterium sp. TaxID=2665914 RepID=UPI003BAD8E62
MKRIALLLALTLATNLTFAQEKWFVRFTDSISLVNNANKIATIFVDDIKKIKPDIKFDIKAIMNTTPSLIFYNENTKTVNLPLWEQLKPEQKNFFYEVAGNEESGKTAFGLFFNGFYLSHELGHTFQHQVQGSLPQSYDSEYFANTIAILWWRKRMKEVELKQCYEYAKKMWSQLPNPVPKEMSIQKFFTENFEVGSQSPYSYGYMQFHQFIQIYEDKTLTDFDTFIKQH